MSEITAEQIITLLRLVPLAIEGGLYRQSYRSGDILQPSDLPPRYQHPKPAGTAIYYLLSNNPDCFSLLHRLPTDEVYHFYLGDPLQLTMLLANGEMKQVVLGPDLLNGQHVQYVVPAGVIHGSRLIPGGKFALVGTTMAPGYTEEDFKIADRETLLDKYPDHAGIILDLTREETQDG